MESELLTTVMFPWQGSLLHRLEHNDSITKVIQITIAEFLKCFLITISIAYCNKFCPCTTVPPASVIVVQLPRLPIGPP